MRGRKLFTATPSLWRISIEKEKSPWGDENDNACATLRSELLIEKEKSPWGDENGLPDIIIEFSKNRKREIPVRGRKRLLYGTSPHREGEHRKREIPVRGRKLVLNRHVKADALIEKEKSPWGDENFRLRSTRRIDLYRKREIPVRGRKRIWDYGQ